MTIHSLIRIPIREDLGHEHSDPCCTQQAVIHDKAHAAYLTILVVPRSAPVKTTKKFPAITQGG